MANDSKAEKPVASTISIGSLTRYLQTRKFGEVSDDNFTHLTSWIFANEKTLIKWGIGPMALLLAMDGDQQAISDVSLRLIQLLEEREKLGDGPETHIVGRGKAIGLDLVNTVVATLLKSALSHNGGQFPRDFAALLYFYVSPSKQQIEKEIASRIGRESAIYLAVKLKEAGLTPSIRKIAKHLGVAPSTVSRWFPDGDFEKEIENGFGRNVANPYLKK